MLFNLILFHCQVKKQGDEELGKRLRKKRKEYGYTQEDLAFASDCSTRYIGKIENARVNPSYNELKKIIREGLKTTEREFFSD
jgi:transcriptional regulator with XRE-family HTH domain